MKNRQNEDNQLTYYKLLDGLLMKSGGRVCDSSFNDYVTARYLADKNLFDTVYTLTFDKLENSDKIVPVKIDNSVAQAMRRLRVDTHISLGGTFMYQPVHDVVYALHGTLSVGGRLIIGVYPNIYDSQGRDVMAMLSDRAQMPVKDKLRRWSVTIENSIHNLFNNIKAEEIISDASIGEITSLFASDSFHRFLFKNEVDHEMFFEHLSEEQKYYMSWKIIRGLRI